MSTAAPGWGSWTFSPIVIVALLAAAYVYRRMYLRAAARLKHVKASPPGAARTPKRKRRLAEPAVISKHDAPRVKKLLGAKSK